MPSQEVHAPGHALNDYLATCERILDAYAHNNISWSTMFDQREQAVARLNGQLVDHFLVRAHNRRVQPGPDGQRRDVRAEAGR